MKDVKRLLCLPCAERWAQTSWKTKDASPLSFAFPVVFIHKQHSCLTLEAISICKTETRNILISLNAQPFYRPPRSSFIRHWLLRETFLRRQTITENDIIIKICCLMGPFKNIVNCDFRAKKLWNFRFCASSWRRSPINHRAIVKCVLSVGGFSK